MLNNLLIIFIFENFVISNVIILNIFFQIKHYEYLNNKKTLKSLMGALENTLHYVADILVDHQNATYHNEVHECFYKFVGGPSYSRPGL